MLSVQDTMIILTKNLPGQPWSTLDGIRGEICGNQVKTLPCRPLQKKDYIISMKRVIRRYLKGQLAKSSSFCALANVDVP
jgi:hypothetical protein